MAATLAPTVSPHRVGAFLGITSAETAKLFEALYAVGLNVREWPLDRALAAVRAYRAGHTVDAVELLLHWPYLNSSGWLVSTEDDAHIFPSLLQAMAAIDSKPYVSYRLTALDVLRADAA